MERFSVKKPYTVLVAVLMVLVLGFVSLTNMTTDLLPSVNIPYMLVITPYPGASPEKVEGEVTQPMEGALGTVTGVTNVYSTSSENVSVVQLEFEDGTNMDSAMVKVSSSVQQVAPTLPELCGTPSILEMSPDMMPAIYLGVGREGGDIYTNSSFIRDEVIPVLERQPGVARVSAEGLVEQSIQVDLNRDKIDRINDDILSMTDKNLAKVRQELDRAEAEVKKGQAALEKQKAQFGSSVADGLMGPLKEQMVALAGKLQTALDPLQKQVEDLYQTVTDPELRQALESVKTDLSSFRSILEKMKQETATPEDLLQVVKLSVQIQKDLTQVLTRLSEQSAPDSSDQTVEQPGLTELIAGIRQGLSDMMKQADQLPKLADGLKTAVGGLTQMQLEAAVGFASAQNQLAAAEAQLKTARAEYESAREKALESANLDQLLSVSTLSGMIYAQNFAMPAGYIDDKDDNSWLLKIGEEYDSSEDIAQSLLCHVDGVGDVRLSDVADITFIDNSGDSYAKLNGTPAVVLSIFKNSTAGTNEVSRNCRDAIEGLSKKFDGFQSVVLMDQGDYITLIVHSVVNSMVAGAILAIIVLALFLKDVKPTLVVGISIPLSVLFAIVLMYFSHLSLNMMTLSGLALGHRYAGGQLGGRHRKHL